MIQRVKSISKALKIYFVIIALTAFALALTNSIMSNFFRDAYHVSAYQRGALEFPRELPGVLVLLIVAGLSFLTDIKISIVAQVLSIIGILALGLATPSYTIMVLFIFINSLGMHIFMPVQDSIGMAMIKGDNIGKRMGQYRGVSTLFAMLGSILVFLGFRYGFFSFMTTIKLPFIIAAMIFFVVLILLLLLEHENRQKIKTERKINFIFRKEYKYYYILVILFGVQKQMMIVYAPWVFIELLGKKADTMALLGMGGALVGVFFIPWVGRLLDRFGVKSILYMDALSFIGVYILYGVLVTVITVNQLGTSALIIGLTYALFIIDSMSNQLGMVRTIYLRTIAVDPTDITPTLSLGVSMDHVVSITCAFLAGIIWGNIGPQYIFFIAAAISCINLYIAFKVKIKKTVQ